MTRRGRASVPDRGAWDDVRWTAGEFVVLDIETSGRRPPEVVELALLVVVGGEVTERFCEMFKPVQAISEAATEVHGISNADVASAPGFGSVAEHVAAVLHGRYLVAHNAAVDWNVLRRSMPQARPRAVLDTQRLARKVHPGQPSYNLFRVLQTLGLAERMEGVQGQAHRAGYDALAALHLLRYLATSARSQPLSLGALVSASQIVPRRRVR